MKQYMHTKQVRRCDIGLGKNRWGSKLIKQGVEFSMAKKTKGPLRKIASTMREEYKSNKNLTVFR
jgi:hypothetical protein